MPTPIINTPPKADNRRPYLNLGGDHSEGRRVYKRGETVWSDKPLDQMFKGKFQPLQVPAASVNILVPPPLEPEPTNAPTGLVDGTGNPLNANPAVVVTGTAADEPLGEDVTAEFPTATKAELLVFKKDKSYYVSDPANPTSALNTEPLKKGGVDPFLESYVAQ